MKRKYLNHAKKHPSSKMFGVSVEEVVSEY